MDAIDRPRLKFWNTLTRTKDDFVPMDETNVQMYVCGPTVYDFAHIGNARPAIVFDVLFRLLRHVYGDSHVTYVRNITDVDDKINARALRDHPDMPLNAAIRLVTEKTAAQYFKDVNALGCLDPTVQPRATEHIDGMVAMIQTLIAKGHAYVASGREGREVLFSVGSMPSYGALSNRKLEDQQAGARVAVEEHKRNAADFVLWKESDADQPGWPATFTDGGAPVSIYGRPGWHIECSVMSKAHLGETFDIHGGGLDLIFPHHENEIAQSCCAHDTPVMANVWMHNGFLQVEGKKMSKSDGNFVTIQDLLETDKFGGRSWPGEVLRLAMLMTHYREPIDFSVRRLEEARAISLKFAAITRRHLPTQGRVLPEVLEALVDDLNTPLALMAIQRSAAAPADLVASLALLGTLDNHLADMAADLLAHQSSGGTSSVETAMADIELQNLGVARSRVDNLISQRLTVIKAKNWGEADRIRDELLAHGIQLKDGKDPVTGERVTTWEVKR